MEFLWIVFLFLLIAGIVLAGYAWTRFSRARLGPPEEDLIDPALRNAMQGAPPPEVVDKSEVQTPDTLERDRVPGRDDTGLEIGGPARTDTARPPDRTTPRRDQAHRP